MIAYVQVLDGLPATDGCYVAWRGLEERGWEVRPFAHSGEIDVSPAHPVIGGIGSVVGALRQLGIVPPDIDYPESLREYCLDPSVGLRTMGWVRRTPAAWPTFVKPTTGRKEFVGMTVRTTADLLRVTQVDDDLPVFVSRPADLSDRVEWRAFVVDGKVRDVRPYSGCPDRTAPNRTVIQAFADLWVDRPRGCSIDVVDMGDDAEEWRIIECNDGYALGHYGLRRATYLELLLKRWGELVLAGDLWTD